MPLNEKMKILLITKRISQADLCQMTGIAESRMSRIINNRVKPMREEKELIAGYLGVEPQEIFDNHTVF